MQDTSNEEITFISVETLTQWGNTPATHSEKAQTGQKSKFPFDASLNGKVVLWKGDIITLSGVDAVVNSTNEAMTERNEVSKRIFSSAGKELQVAVQKLEGCKTGEARITPGFELKAKWVIHTVGPRFNDKYRIAAENALHNCYRNSLQALTENGGRSIAFSVINSEKRGYPPENGAHIAMRTVRRFLERYGNMVSLVIFCMESEIEYELYDKILWMYFPRNKGEESSAIKSLPEDTGNEIGETVVEERKIRILETPSTGGGTEVEDGHLFRSLTEMKDHPDKDRMAPKKEAESMGFCTLI